MRQKNQETGMKSVECSEQGQEPAEGIPIRGVMGKIGKAFEGLSEEVRELSLGTTGEVELVKGSLSPVEFLRNYMLPGRPCIITDALDHWPALQKWSNDYLSSVLRNHSVSVHFTPDGRADALVDPQHMLTDYNCPIVVPSSTATPTSPSAAPSSESLSSRLETEVHNGKLEHENVPNDDHEAQNAAGGSDPQVLYL